LDIEEPVSGRYASVFHFHATLASMLGPALIRDEVVQVGESREKRLLAATGMMEALHGEQFPLDGVMGLIQQGTGRGHLRGREHHIPPRLLLLQPAPHPFAIGCSSRGGDVIDKMASPLTQRKHAHALALACPV
jgi:hypothetical protein